MTADDRAPRSPSGYSKVAITLHWLIALMIVGNVIIVLWAGALEGEAASRALRGTIMGAHKSVGLTVLGLSLVRLFWRLTHGFPRLPEHMATWEITLARANHLAFYALMIVVPLAGWIMVSPGSRPLVWFGLFDVPKLPVVKGSLLAGAAHEAHEILAFAMVGLLVLHIAGALKHHFIDRDDVLARMLPLVRPRRSTGIAADRAASGDGSTL